MDKLVRRRIPILILTQEHCAFCKQARDILERLSREYSVDLSTLDMGSPEGLQLATQGGLLFPPGILIDGKPFSYGRLSERKLQRELDRRWKQPSLASTHLTHAPTLG